MYVQLVADGGKNENKKTIHKANLRNASKYYELVLVFLCYARLMYAVSKWQTGVMQIYFLYNNFHVN